MKSTLILKENYVKYLVYVNTYKKQKSDFKRYKFLILYDINTLQKMT